MVDYDYYLSKAIIINSLGSLLELVTKKKGKRRSPNWGGARENAGRKSSWNHKETCTIRIPQVFAPKIREIAQKLDKGQQIDFEIKSSLKKPVSDSRLQLVEKDTKSKFSELDKITDSNCELTEAIDLAKKILFP